MYLQCYSFIDNYRFDNRSHKQILFLEIAINQRVRGQYVKAFPVVP